MYKGFISILVCYSLFSCGYFTQEAEGVAVARVNDTYLYESDIQGLIPEATSKEDSILLVNSYITRWATQQLLIDQARINLSQDKLAQFTKLVEEYKNDLLTEAYKNAIVLQQMDSVVSENELMEFYEANKENFKLNDELVKVRYLQVDENYSNLPQAREKLSRFNKKDKLELLAMGIQFKSFNFNDSIWVKKDALLKALPVLQDKTEQVLKKSNFTQLQDSLGLYLVKIENVLNPNDIAPLSHVRPTIEQIILNKRKLELIKTLETDITKDAIKNNDFEIYKKQ